MSGDMPSLVRKYYSWYQERCDCGLNKYAVMSQRMKR
jgi:hypothetical protein